MDSAPAHRHGVHAGSLRGSDVEGRVADVDGLARRPREPVHGEEDGIRVRLVPLGVLEADDDVEGVREGRKALERQRNRAMPLRRDDSELAALRLESGKKRDELVEGLEGLVETVVVLLVGLEQVVRMGLTDGRTFISLLHPEGDSAAGEVVG